MVEINPQELRQLPQQSRRSILKRFARNRAGNHTPTAVHVLVESVGIDEIQNALETVVVIYDDLKKAYDDDQKLTLTEIGLTLLKRAGKAWRVFSHIKDIGIEFLDLDAAERKALTDHFARKFELENKVAEQKIEAIFNLCLYLADGITDFILTWQEIEDALKQPPTCRPDGE